MAHDIENEFMIYAGETPWHGIGTKLTSIDAFDNASVTEALALCPIFGSEIDAQPAGFVNARGEFVEIPGSFANVRAHDGKGLAVVGAQHIQAGQSPRALIDRLAAMTGGKIHTAAMLDGGRRMFATAALGAPLELRAPNGFLDEVKFFVQIAAGFDCSMAVTQSISSERTVCANTLAVALAIAKMKFSAKQTRSCEVKADEHSALMTDAMRQYEAFAATIQILARAPFSDAQSSELFRAILGADLSVPEADLPKRTLNNLDTLRQLQAGGKGNAPWAGTAWAALNAATEYADHHMVVRGARTEDAQDKTAEGIDKILTASTWGRGATLKAQALDLILAQVQP